MLDQSTRNSWILHDSEEGLAIISCVCVCVCVCVCGYVSVHSTFPPHFANSIEGQEEVIQTPGTGGKGLQLCSEGLVWREAQSDLGLCAIARECSGTALIDWKWAGYSHMEQVCLATSLGSMADGRPSMGGIDWLDLP